MGESCPAGKTVPYGFGACRRRRKRCPHRRDFCASRLTRRPSGAWRSRRMAPRSRPAAPMATCCSTMFRRATCFVNAVSCTHEGHAGAIWLWEAGTGEVLRKFEGVHFQPFTVSFSRDGLKASSSSKDRTIRIWDVAAGNELRCLSGHDPAVASQPAVRLGRVHGWKSCRAPASRRGCGASRGRDPGGLWPTLPTLSSGTTYEGVRNPLSSRSAAASVLAADRPPS
jgi:hypothetical protein